jgi:iron complex transport system substrate-binding protein
MLNSARGLTRRSSILALALVALAGASCGERGEPVGSLAQPYPVTVNGAGDRPTVLERRPRRIVALDPGSAQLLLAIGAGDRLVGAPVGVKLKGVQPARVVRATGQVNVDAIVGLAPDLIVSTPSVDELDVARAARESGSSVYVQPANSIVNVEQGAVDLGFLTGQAAEARQLVGRIEHHVAAVEDRLASEETVSLFVDTGFFITVPTRSLLGDLVTKARGRNVAGASPGPGPFPLSDLARLNPRIYLATSDSSVTLHALRANPATRSLKAVRAGRLVVVPADKVTWPGPNVANGLEAIARALHPDAFR